MKCENGREVECGYWWRWMKRVQCELVILLAGLWYCNRFPPKESNHRSNCHIPLICQKMLFYVRYEYKY